MIIYQIGFFVKEKEKCPKIIIIHTKIFPQGDFKSVGQKLITQKKKEKVVSLLAHEGMVCKKAKPKQTKPKSVQ